MPSVSVQTVIVDSLVEIGVLAQGESLPADMGTFCLGRLNQLVDNWNAEREAVWAEEFHTFAFVASQQDYDLGPTGDWVLASRPVGLDGANVIITSTSPSVRNPINIRDYQWWMNLSVRSVSTSFPTDVYYEPSWPDGVLHFWPVPSLTYDCELVVRVLLSQLTLNGSLNMPPGYQNAIMLTLAEGLAGSYGRQVKPMTTKLAAEARVRIFNNNHLNLRLRTQDAGMPSQNRNRATFNYRTGLDINVNR